MAAMNLRSRSLVTADLPESQSLPHWNIFKKVPESIRSQVQYANVTKRYDTGWYFYALMVTDDDQFYVIGDNRSGQLGVGSSKKMVHAATKIQDLCGQNIIGLSTSWTNSAVWTKDGRVFMLGENEKGQLGLGHEEQVSSPQLMDIEWKAKKVSLGGGHALGLSEDGNVFAWGKNSSNQCSPSSDSFVNSPIHVEISSNVADIGCTSNSSFALTEDGEVYAWGFNGFNEAGDSSSNSSIPNKITFPDDVTITQIACGHSHVLTLTQDGTIYAWGNNACGQIGNCKRQPFVYPPRMIDISNVDHIAASNSLSTSLCRDRTGQVYAWRNYADPDRTFRPQSTNFQSIHTFLAAKNLGMFETWVSSGRERQGASQEETNPGNAELQLIQVSTTCPAVSNRYNLRRKSSVLEHAVKSSEQ